MTSQTRKTVAIDIDDVVAMTSEAVRVWANDKSGVHLQPQDYFLDNIDDYWNYYESVWEHHGIVGLHLSEFLDGMDRSQAHIGVAKDAQRVIERLKKDYDIVFITARRPVHKDSSRQWLDEHIDTAIPLYLSQNPFANEAARSKGEICAELGVDVLIDDNVDNCRSAVQYGVDVVLFGNYGWNVDAPADMTRCISWSDVGEYLDGRE